MGGDPLKIYMALMIALFAVAIGLLAYEIWFVVSSPNAIGAIPETSFGSAFGADNPSRRSTLPTITIAKATGPRQPHLNKR